MKYAELREQALEANLEIVRAGLVVLTFGNASALDRDAGIMAIKPSGVPYDDLSPETMVLIDLETGNTVEGDLRPSSDTPTHLVLYRRFATIGGIVHTHSPFATAWAQACQPIPCLGTTHADHFYGSVPVSRKLTADEIAGEYEANTGVAIVDTLVSQGLDPLQVPATLVWSHGPFTWGPDAATAAENAVALEAVAASTLRACQINPSISSVQPELLDKHFLRKHGANAYYGQVA